MRKKPQAYDLEIPDDDYKMADVMRNEKADFESQNIWLYIGAKQKDPRFAKVGMTMRDMTSRSSYSGDPRFYLFCAFQCKHDTTELQLRKIERDVLSYLDEMYPNKRARHFESQRLSECFHDIDFEEFFFLTHQYLRDHYGKYFQKKCFGEEYALSWEFNSHLPRSEWMPFLRSILILGD
ncbi:hypothetical protein [Citrobacter braakii]|uniref:hypothetical protein n=1 Tax=Citrobacter braakii TaxID=57706 RepID=UPI0034E3D7F1